MLGFFLLLSLSNLCSSSLPQTIRILGIFDPAAKLGFEEKGKEDFGQTMGVWGAKSGCYFVLPILGPTTVRDSFGMLADSFVDPFAHVTIRENELLGISGNDLDVRIFVK